MDFLNDLPNPIKALLAVLTGTGIFAGLAMLDVRLAGIIAAGAVLLALAITIFYVVRGWNQKRRASSLAGELQQHSTAAPQGVSDVNKRAKLEDLRTKFASGISKFGNAENIYRFPWYLIVGEPGGGKSEAIRHSNVGFPPGMQDELQGVGGTINMNWWFTNQAVFLDTAGRLMFEEVRPGENNEWREFLQLLSRNRPNCPINGLLLVIPADSLIKDTDQQLQKKAGQIAQQFDLIQRTLDIRFPVFVLITKCDLLAGFREFFEDFSDAQSQQQMIGWANPLDRDQPFRPDLVTEHIDTVVQRIRKRRLSLLRDPVPQKGSERRADEVDALFAFPQSLTLIAPRLRTYLEQIFVAGPWSPKPLFLRGIHFASSMREGESLDQELAQALGTSIDDLPEGRTWERERAYFLRDLFTEKLFKERGLVTRASNTRKMLRTRSLVLWGSGSALALLFVGFTIYGYHQFRNSIQSHRDYWNAAKSDWKPGVWRPLVSTSNPEDSHFQYRGDDTVLNTAEGSVSLTSFHERLRTLASQPIETSWVYRPMLKLIRLEGERKRAQRIVYEASAVSPVLSAARQRMIQEKLDEAPDASEQTSTRLLHEAEAVAALIRAESEVLSSEHNLAAVPKTIIEPLLSYSTAYTAGVDSKKLGSIGDTFSATYSNNPQAVWPPTWFSKGATNLAANKAIQKGIERLKTLAGSSAKSQLENLDRLKGLRDSLREFRSIERQMDSTAPLSDLTPADKAKRMDEYMVSLDATKRRIDENVRIAREHQLTTGDNVILAAAYKNLVEGSQTQAAEAFKVVKTALKGQLANDQQLLFREADRELDETLGSLKSQIAQGFTEKEQTELAELDPLLANFGDGRLVYEVRSSQYTAAQREATVKDDVQRIIGLNWVPLADVQRKIDGQRSQISSLKEKLDTFEKGAPFSKTCAYYLDRAYNTRVNAILDEYVRQTRSRFDATFHQPLVIATKGQYMSAKAMDDAETLAAMWDRDISSPVVAPLATQSPQMPKLTAFAAELKKIDYSRIKKAMNSKVIVKVPGWGQNNQASLAEWRAVVINGRKYDIAAGESPSSEHGIGGTWTATFQNFPNNATKSETVSLSARQLFNSAKSNGGRASVSVQGKSILLEVSAEGSAEGVDDIPRPAKDKLLGILR